MPNTLEQRATPFNPRLGTLFRLLTCQIVFLSREQVRFVDDVEFHVDPTLRFSIVECVVTDDPNTTQAIDSSVDVFVAAPTI